MSGDLDVMCKLGRKNSGRRRGRECLCGCEAHGEVRAPPPSVSAINFVIAIITSLQPALKPHYYCYYCYYYYHYYCYYYYYFKNCFGIELLSDRHAHAKKLAYEFTTKALSNEIIFSPIMLAEGSCLTAEICKTKLRAAGLVWINNEIFHVDLNQSILTLLTETVPKGCIIVSFREIFLPKRHLPKESADFKVISEELVENAVNWTKKPMQTFVIQRL